ncbi:hypothetical protein BJ508DRAFT_302543 [Ascobolus immersus RN42]|uniref:TATA element modulatory factor 1 TATA binding domain-containing protein n=1 Tax=Ascobolus immersus RN42 TaxID=1160509 RepID=A0A3N4IHU6_ASCIM|nr:hypothetical protein BJ508DRAFT_302543 [Ascobolus immersus RN42]
MNFLSKAVTGLESRLDKVLLSGEPEPPSSSTPPPPSASAPPPATDDSLKPTSADKPGLERSSSTKSVRSLKDGAGKGQPRLSMQERLAMAMARAKAGSPASVAASSPRGSLDVRRDSGEVRRSEDGRGSGEVRRERKEEKVEDKKEEEKVKEDKVEDKKEEEKTEVKTEEKVKEVETKDIPEIKTTPAEDKVEAEAEAEKEQEKEDGKESTTEAPEAVEPVQGETTPPQATSEPPVAPSSPPPSPTPAPPNPQAAVDPIPPPPHPSPSPRPILESRPTHTRTQSLRPAASTKTSEEYELLIDQLRSDLITCEMRRQEEVAASADRIDTLETQLKTLTASLTDATAKSTDSSTLQKKLSAAEEKCALLLEEGERMSKRELQLNTAIKRLRTKVQEEEKTSGDAKKRLEKLEKENGDLVAKAKKGAEDAKKLDMTQKTLNKLESEFGKVLQDRDRAKTELEEARARVKAAEGRAVEAEGRAQTEALEAERRVSGELRGQVEQLRGEKEKVEEQWKREVRELEEKVQAEVERGGRVERELKNEQLVMETKMEGLRARLEELSTGAGGDAQAKLLRQIEMLQGQQASLQERWRTQEMNLNAKVAAVEKERDEAVKREGDVRKKARELNQKAKRLEMELESANIKIKDLEHDLTTQTELVESLQQKVTDLDKKLTEMAATIEQQKATFDTELTTRLDEEKAKWEESLQFPPPVPHNFYSQTRKNSGGLSDLLSPISRRSGPSSTTFLRTGSITADPTPILAEPHSLNRRIRAHIEGTTSPPIRHQDSNLSLPQLSTAALTKNNNTSQLSLASFSPNPDHPHDTESHSHSHFPHSPAFPPSRQYTQDMLSASTVAAGPSVQLVERMSAAVRRLESEVSGLREELHALSTSRDEARAEIVDLMKENEEKKEVEQRLKKCQAEMAQLEERFATTLEMLGEKEEMVEELRHDVADWKEMYRELVQSSTK